MRNMPTKDELIASYESMLRTCQADRRRLEADLARRTAESERQDGGRSRDVSTEAREIVDAIRADYRERTGACPLPDALAAAPVTDGRRWVLASDRDYQFAALVERGGMSVWWRRGFMSPEWRPYEYTVLPIVLWMPADPANLPAGFTLPEVSA